MLIINDQKTCPLPSIDNQRRTCHAYIDDNGVCARGHAVSDDMLIPLNEEAFTITGGIDTPVDATPILSHDDRIVGYQLPDGRKVRLSLALEVESADGETHTYAATGEEIERLGFGVFDYRDAYFGPDA